MRYDYKCPRCHAVTEVRHGMTEDPEIRCVICDIPMKRVVTGGVGFGFRCSGFYQTDKVLSDMRDEE